MPELMEWDVVGQRTYETGTCKGVLYDYGEYTPEGAEGPVKGYINGVPWSGLTKVSENPSGAETTGYWADDMKYFELTSAEEFGATIECYSYPDEWAKHNGEGAIAEGIEGVTITMQPRTTFGFCYRTTIGDDVVGNERGYKLHLVYGAKAKPSTKDYSTINDSPEAITFSYEMTTTPVNVPGKKPTACIVIDSTKCDAAKLKTLEDILYAKTGARLPLPEELITIFGTISGGAAG